jgi:DNA-binding transcriptional regulator YbjK
MGYYALLLRKEAFMSATIEKHDDWTALLEAAQKGRWGTVEALLHSYMHSSDRMQQVYILLCSKKPAPEVGSVEERIQKRLRALFATVPPTTTEGAP